MVHTDINDKDKQLQAQITEIKNDLSTVENYGTLDNSLVIEKNKANNQVIISLNNHQVDSNSYTIVSTNLPKSTHEVNGVFLCHASNRMYLGYIAKNSNTFVIYPTVNIGGTENICGQIVYYTD